MPTSKHLVMYTETGVFYWRAGDQSGSDPVRNERGRLDYLLLDKARANALRVTGAKTWEWLRVA